MVRSQIQALRPPMVGIDTATHVPMPTSLPRKLHPKAYRHLAASETCSEVSSVSTSSAQQSAASAQRKRLIIPKAIRAKPGVSQPSGRSQTDRKACGETSLSGPAAAPAIVTVDLADLMTEDTEMGGVTCDPIHKDERQLDVGRELTELLAAVAAGHNRSATASAGIPVHCETLMRLRLE